MSRITNNPGVTNDERADVLRGAVGTRALWMALIYEEACKAGLAEEGEAIIRRAVTRYGLNQGESIRKSLRMDEAPVDMEKFAEAFGSPAAVGAFSAGMRLNEKKELNIEYHFCPLLKAWQDQGYDDGTCAKLCDMAMEGDRHMARGMGMGFELTDTIANGCATCKMKFFAEDKKDGETGR